MTRLELTLDPYGPTSGSSTGLATFFLIFGLFYVVMAVLFLFAWSRILKKAGYPAAYALFGLIPVVNIILFFVFAFGTWPIHRRGGPGGYGGYPSQPYNPTPTGPAAQQYGPQRWSPPPTQSWPPQT